MYGVTSFGMTLNLHYCCGKLDNVSLSNAKANNCRYAALNNKGCCNSKQIHLTIKADQDNTFAHVQFNALTAVIIHHQTSSSLLPLQSKTVNQFSNGPPLIAYNNSLYLKNCVFKI